ncbi:hypothetical protein [Methylobacterium sp. CM6257]
MRIIAARATALVVMVLVLGTARMLDDVGIPRTILGFLVAAMAATTVLLLARR